MLQVFESQVEGSWAFGFRTFGFGGLEFRVLREVFWGSVSGLGK